MRRFFLTGDPTKDVGVSQDVVERLCKELRPIPGIPMTVGERSVSCGESRDVSSLSSICLRIGRLLDGVIGGNGGVALMAGDGRLRRAFSFTAAARTSKSISVLIKGCGEGDRDLTGVLT
jgi:hypothetical protein